MRKVLVKSIGKKLLEHELNFCSRLHHCKQKGGRKKIITSETMHFTFVTIVVLVCFSTIHSHPASPVDERNELNLQRARPIQQFFKNVLNALRSTTTPEPPTTTTKRVFKPSSFQEIPNQAIPNFVDFSTYLLGGITSNNSAIKFTYIEPSANAAPSLRGNYSVVSFLIPHKADDGANSKGVFSFLGNARLPWNRQPSNATTPSNTDYSQFPPVLEYFTQRVQSYFSIYKYTDESRLNNTIVVLIPDDEIFATSNKATTDGSPIVQSDDGAETTTDYLNLQQDTTTNVISSEIE